MNKDELNEDQTNKVTTWACTVPFFTRDSLTGQVSKLRDLTVDASEAAYRLIREWKARGKIKFVRGYWKWQF